jgi:hypothetical protein
MAFHYFYYGFLIIKMCEYTNIIEHTVNIASNLFKISKFVFAPAIKNYDPTDDSEWILIMLNETCLT